MSTSVSAVTKHFPSAENGFATTTAGTVAEGATTVTLNSVSGYSDGEVVVFIIDPEDPDKKQEFTGTIDTGGVQVTGVVWTGGTNQSHLVGATVVDYPSAAHVSMISKGLLVEHNQDGTHSDISADSVDVDSLIVNTGTTLPAGDIGTNDLANSAVTTAKIADDAVTAAKLDGIDRSLLTVDSNPYKFFAYYNGTANLVGGPTIFTFSSELYDTNSNYDTSAYKYTAPVNGFYRFYAQVWCQSLSDGNAVAAYVYVNGAEVGRNVNVTGATTDCACNIVQTLQLTAGDYVQIYVYNSQGTRNYVSKTGNSYLSYFEGHLISRT